MAKSNMAAIGYDEKSNFFVSRFKCTCDTSILTNLGVGNSFLILFWAFWVVLTLKCHGQGHFVGRLTKPVVHFMIQAWNFLQCFCIPWSLFSDVEAILNWPLGPAMAKSNMAAIGWWKSNFFVSRFICTCDTSILTNLGVGNSFLILFWAFWIVLTLKCHCQGHFAILKTVAIHFRGFTQLRAL